ncbi:hypothetical protein VTP01DRAFT_6694, partial [Rhizomucor pusillus]|uniref:uncharacterized protein n=1 Tax=Rhizomucor pusillus TaxID=4840 RepID=UPI0037447F2F
MMLIACARDPILFWKTGNVGLLPYIPTREAFVINIDAVVIKNVEQQRRGGAGWNLEPLYVFDFSADASFLVPRSTK